MMFLIQGEVDGSNEPFHVHFPVVSIGVIQWLQQTISQNKTSCTVSILPWSPWSIGTKDNWRSAMFSQGICWLPYPHQLEHDVFFDVFCWPAWWTWSECMPRSTPGAEQKTSGWRRGRWLPTWIIPDRKSLRVWITRPSPSVWFVCWAKFHKFPSAGAASPFGCPWVEKTDLESCLITNWAVQASRILSEAV